MDIRNTKLSGATPDKYNTPDHSKFDKQSYDKCTTRKRGLSNTKDWIKEHNGSPKLIVITDTNSNSGTEDKLKVIDNSKVNRTSHIYIKNNTIDYETFDKHSSAKCKTRKYRLSNVTTRKVKDDRKVD